MLRKFVNITTMCLLLISTTGFAVSEHYCGARLVSVEINKEAEPCCDSGMCCHTEIQVFQLQEDFVSTEFNPDLTFHLLVEFNFPEIDLWTSLYAIETDSHLFRIGDSPPPPDRGSRLSSLQRYIL